MSTNSGTNKYSHLDRSPGQPGCSGEIFIVQFILVNNYHMANKSYYIYIISSFKKVLYIGITSNLRKRIWEHREGVVDGFTKKYNIKMLVYYEVYDDPETAIKREKQLKRWRREKKLKLIESMNPEWKDLYEELF